MRENAQNKENKHRKNNRKQQEAMTMRTKNKHEKRSIFSDQCPTVENFSEQELFRRLSTPARHRQRVAPVDVFLKCTLLSFAVLQVFASCTEVIQAATSTTWPLQRPRRKSCVSFDLHLSETKRHVQGGLQYRCAVLVVRHSPRDAVQKSWALAAARRLCIALSWKHIVPIKLY